MAEQIKLTEAEKKAKEFFMLIAKDASNLPCDDEESVNNISLPSWYNEEVYKRGRKYFQDNRVGILYSNLIGLICLLSEPRGLNILQSTGRSGTSTTARKRYISTIAHTVNWYEYDLTPGSKSFESLKRVRKLHYLSSRGAISKNLGFISQAELTITTFGFMGLPLLRPHLLGIKSDSQDDMEAFVHVWAVFCHVLGVEDRFNCCLLPYDALKVFLQMVMRYILLPIIQFETPDFKHMTQAMFDGLQPYLPAINYEVDVFAAKRLLMVPGYQYKTDNTKEVLCRSLLTQKDVDHINDVLKATEENLTKPYISVDIPVFMITRNQNGGDATSVCDSSNVNSELKDYLNNVLQLGPKDIVSVKYINYEKEWQDALSDCKFKELSWKNQQILSIKMYMRWFNTTSIGWYILDRMITFILERIQKKNENNSTNGYKELEVM